MEMREVVSGNIAAVGFDETRREVEDAFGNLDVKFKSGSTYRYKEVPQIVYELFLSAESLGKFFAAEIKPIYKECFKLVKVVDPVTNVETITEVRV